MLSTRPLALFLLWPLTGAAADLAATADPATAEDVPACCRPPGRFAAIAAAAQPAAAAVVERTDAGAAVTLGGEPFAEYRTEAGRQPAVWPIIGPSGHEMTRRYPLADRLPTENNDHPHHVSLWFAHGGVNGHDFWHSADARIAHREFTRLEASGSEAVIATRDDWVAGGEVVLQDARTLAFGEQSAGAGAPRFIDFTIGLTATHGDAVFADTKEGTFGVRVPGVMKTDAGLGGGASNDRGQRDGAAWGQVARWVQYHGPLEAADEGEAPPVGSIVILSHPGSSRPESRWHVREYGLFAANPFGVRDFVEDGRDRRPVRLRNGERWTLRYRVVFAAGEPSPDEIESWYNAFAATPVDAYAAAD